MIIIYVIVFAVIIASLWKIFDKAGEPGWAAIVPIYNIIVLLKIVDRPIWWIVLYLIPCVNIVPAILIPMDLAENFGKSKGWGFGMLVILGIVGYPMLAFGDAQYTKISRQ